MAMATPAPHALFPRHDEVSQRSIRNLYSLTRDKARIEQHLRCANNQLRVHIAEIPIRTVHIEVLMKSSTREAEKGIAHDPVWTRSMAKAKKQLALEVPNREK